MASWWQQPIKAIDKACEQRAKRHQDQLTKPPGSLGRMETLAIQLASHQGVDKPELEKVAVRVFAADHGVMAENVSAFPQAVTIEMIRNFATGGAAISVLSREQGADFQVINVGAAGPVDDQPDLLNTPVAAGTANFCQQPAMTEEQFEAALALGKNIVDHAAEQGVQLFIGGEMGIGNTTAAAAVSAALIGGDSNQLVGVGTGVDDGGLQRKQAAVKKGLALHSAIVGDPLQSLRCLGGLEIAALAGAYLRCGQLGISVLVDGFICSSAALAAVRFNPALRPWLIFSHQSAESGHQRVLAALEAEPLLSLDLRLGEASGAATALPLLRLACSLHNTMATFAGAGVSTSDQ
jgi:nicotinate-nucleotide--dimethylbenzimidazole phosphoribosyltransferase